MNYASPPPRRPAPGPVQTRNALDGLPEALRRVAVRTGDVRKIRRISQNVIEMGIEDARALGLVR